jgi:rhomboid protease GluP
MNARPKRLDGGPDERVAGFFLSSRLVSSSLMLVNFGFFLLCMVLAARMGAGISLLSFPGEVLDLLGAKNGGHIYIQGEWWRLIAAGMLHGGIIHIGFNTWVLMDVGPMVEEFYGGYRTFLIYAVGSICGFAASLWWKPLVPSVGASAGIFALIGAMIAYGYRYRTPIGGAIRNHFIRWAIYMVLIGLIVPFIDQAAHLGGLAGGFLVAWLTGAKPLIEDWRESVIKSAVLLVGVLVAYTFYQIFLKLAA